MIANDTPELRRATRLAMASARICRQKPTHCEKCGAEEYDIHAHHDDYAKPLDVRWLCRSCHIKHHIALRKAAGTYIHNGGNRAMWHAAPPKAKKRRAA